MAERALASDLAGTSVLVAGAGLAGLAAARDLVHHGATVEVVDVRDRVGGRVLTARDGFAEGQHAEAGGDLIEEGHASLLRLARELGLTAVRILRSGWGYVTPGHDGTPRVARRSVSSGWERLAAALTPAAEPYRLAEKRWDTPIARDLARRSVAQWLDAVGADRGLRDVAAGMRGFFLADTDELSLLALVDQFVGDETAIGKMYRIEGGNDLLATRMASSLGDRVHGGVEVLAVSQRGTRVRVAVKHRRRTSQLSADYVVLALPAPLLRRIPMSPSLPVRQHEAISRLPYGHATKSLLQFPRRFWRARHRVRAFGSALRFGAVWDGNEEQRGRCGILSLLAGGSASDATADLVAKGGIRALASELDWLGSRGVEVAGWRQFRWEADPWARGGYAVFDTNYDPSLRGWLPLPHGRLFFAGEHTSIAWQGYMNGAIESGRRAAAEVAATHRARL